MKKILPILVLFVISFTQIHAQSKKESIKEMFGLMHQDSLINKTFDLMTASVISNMSKTIKDTAYYSKVSNIIERSMERRKTIAQRMLNEDMVDIYDKYFSQEEINDLTAFYKSKSGQQLISKIPDIQKDVMMVMAAKYAPTLQAEIMKEFEQLYSDTAAHDKVSQKL